MSEVQPKLQEVFELTCRRYRKLYELLGSVSEAQARLQPDGGGWSVGELAHHVVLTQGRILRAVERLLEQAEIADLPPDPDPASAAGSLDFIAERAREGKFEAPPQAVPRLGRPLGQSLEELREQEAALARLLPRLGRRDLRQLKFPHPVFGDFDVYQWILFLGGHAARHTRQMLSVMKEAS